MTETQRVYLKTDFALEKLLWRYSQGWYDESHISYELKYQLDKLADRSFKLNDKIGDLRRFCQSELIRLDNLRGEIIRHIGRLEFETAIKKIRDADEILRELEGIAAAIKQYYSHQESIDKLQTITGKGLFSNIPTFKIISNLHEKTREYLERKQSQRARLNLLFCQGEISLMLGIQKDISRSTQLQRRLDGFVKALIQIHEIKSLGAGKDNYFSKIIIIEQLIKSGYLALAARLTEEFEIEISDKILFYTEYQKASIGMESSALEKIIAFENSSPGEKANPWDELSGKILEERLKRNLSHLSKIGEQIKKNFDNNKEDK